MADRPTPRELAGRRRELLRQLEERLDLAAGCLLQSAARSDVAQHVQGAREILNRLDRLEAKGHK